MGLFRIPWVLGDARGFGLDRELDVAFTGIGDVEVVVGKRQSGHARPGVQSLAGTAFQEQSQDIVEVVPFAVLDIALICHSLRNKIVERLHCGKDVRFSGQPSAVASGLDGRIRGYEWRPARLRARLATLGLDLACHTLNLYGGATVTLARCRPATAAQWRARMPGWASGLRSTFSASSGARTDGELHVRGDLTRIWIQLQYAPI